jgi:sugar/nucleoside kinase (ribokinase family)
MRAAIVHLAPLIAGEAPRAFVEELSQWGLLSLDAQGFLRVHRDGALRLERNEEFEDLIRSAAFLKLDHAEAETLTGQKDLGSALERIQKLGAREIVLTHATGVISCRNGKRVDAPWTAQNLSGRTGRGDTCMSTYLACRALDIAPEEALPLAAELTSRKMEQEGPFRRTLADLDPAVTAPLLKKLPRPTTATPQG